MSFEVSGKQLEAKPRNKANNDENTEEFFENRVLKPLPDYSYNPDLKELATAI